MSNRLDQLFKDSLSEHKVSPSAGAWEKVQSGLSKHNKILIAWRMAAVLILFGAVVSARYFIGRSEINNPKFLTGTKEFIAPEKVGKEKSSNPNTESVRTTIAQTTKQSIITKRKTKIIKGEIGNGYTKNTTPEQSESQNIVQYPISTEPMMVTQSSKPEKPTVIEFTLPSISNTPTEEVAQISKEENSGLKKILETARDVKNGDSDLGIIWDTKNQLFALDFKKDKTKRN